MPRKTKPSPAKSSTHAWLGIFFIFFTVFGVVYATRSPTGSPVAQMSLPPPPAGGSQPPSGSNPAGAKSPQENLIEFCRQAYMCCLVGPLPNFCIECLKYLTCPAPSSSPPGPTPCAVDDPTCSASSSSMPPKRCNTDFDCPRCGSCVLWECKMPECPKGEKLDLATCKCKGTECVKNSDCQTGLDPKSRLTACNYCSNGKCAAKSCPSKGCMETGGEPMCIQCDSDFDCAQNPQGGPANWCKICVKNQCQEKKCQFGCVPRFGLCNQCNIENGSTDCKAQPEGARCLCEKSAGDPNQWICTPDYSTHIPNTTCTSIDPNAGGKTPGVPAGTTGGTGVPPGGTTGQAPSLGNTSGNTGTTGAGVPSQGNTGNISPAVPNGGQNTSNAQGTGQTPVTSGPISFPDVPGATRLSNALFLLTSRGIVKGYSDGKFHPEATVTRAEAAAILERFIGLRLDTLPAAVSVAPDVPKGAWFTGVMALAKEIGIMKGYDDGSMRPMNSVTREEFLKMASVALQLPMNTTHSFIDIPKGTWIEGPASIATRYALETGSQFQPGEALTRAEVAEYTAALLMQLGE